MNILIVDDEVTALRDLFRVIEKTVPDVTILQAEDAETALSLCWEHPVDVAFLDISMPGTDGLTLAKEMKQLRPLLNIVMVTAYANFALDALKLYVSDYILKPAMPADIKNALGNLRTPVINPQKGLFVRCFGNFEVFYDGKPIRFGRAKTKELFACLIDRRGSTMTNAELRAVLWMDETRDEEKQRKYFAQLVYELQYSLYELGLSDIFIHSRNAYAIVPEKIPCDYYLALEHDTKALSMYRGEYMHQYEWASFWIGTREKELRFNDVN